MTLGFALESFLLVLFEGKAKIVSKELAPPAVYTALRVFMSRRYVTGIPSIFSYKIIISRWAFGSQPSAVIACVLNKNVVSWQTRNNTKLPKHKLNQNAKNLQCLLKFGLVEDNVTVFQWSWNSESGLLVNLIVALKKFEGKRLRTFKKMLFSWEGLF